MANRLRIITMRGGGTRRTRTASDGTLTPGPGGRTPIRSGSSRPWRRSGGRGGGSAGDPSPASFSSPGLCSRRSDSSRSTRSGIGHAEDKTPGAGWPTTTSAPLYLKRGLHEEAGAAIAALRLRADYPEAHHKLGAVLEEQGDLAGAEVHLRRAMERDSPVSWQTHHVLGLVFKKQGKYREAADQFRRPSG